MKIDRQDYEILGLQPGASGEEIKQAYRKLVKVWHPDRFVGEPQRQREAEAKIKQINEAYNRLKSNPVPAKIDDRPSTGTQKTSGSVKYTTGQSAVETYYHRGVAAFERGAFHEAIEEMTQAIRLDGKYIEAYRVRGRACSQLGYENRFRSDMRRALELELERRSNPPQPKPDSRPSSPASSTGWRHLGRRREHSEAVSSLAVSPQGTILASGSFDRTIKLWHPKTRKPIRTLSDHSGRVRCLAIDGSDRILASGSADKTIKIWDLKTGNLLQTLGGWFFGHSDEVSALAFDRTGRILVSGSTDKTLKIWDLRTGREIDTITGNAAQILSLAIDPAGKTIISSGLEKNIRVRQLKTGKLVRSISGNAGYVFSVAIHPAGQILASGSLSKIKLMRLDQKEELHTLSGHSNSVYALDFSSDGKMLVSGSFDRTVRLWEVETGREIDRLSESKTPIYAIAFLPDGQTIVSGSEDGTLNFWQRNHSNRHSQ